MKKRFLALFLCCVMVFTLLPAALTTAFATGEADEETAPAQEIVDVEPEGTGDLDDTQPDPDGQPVDPDAEPVVCTCGAAADAAHAEDCPLYVNPEQPADDEKKPEDEQPVVTKPVDSTALFERLMAAETMEAFEAIIEETPEEQLKALTEEQVAQVEAHAESLEPEPLPPIDVTPSEPPVQSEVYRPTVNYTNVAPFGAPVTGGHR